MLKYHLKNATRNFLSLSSKPTDVAWKAKEMFLVLAEVLLDSPTVLITAISPASPCFPINHRAYCLQSVMNEEFCN